MIKLVNSELFDVATTKETSAHGDYCKTTFKSSIATKSQFGDSNYKRVITVANSNYNPNTGAFVDMNDKTHINALDHNKVNIRVGQKVKRNTNVYLIAIPFNGILKPVEKSFDYRIYRGFILKSDKKNIKLNGETFKKVAYLVVNPNEGVYRNDHKYHKDELELRLETFNLETVEGESRTVNTTHIVKFTPDNDPEYTKVNNTTDPFDIKSISGRILFPIVESNTPAKDQSASEDKHAKLDSKIDSMIEEFNRKYDEERAADKRDKKKHK